jgi:hypothetical protein
MIGFQIALVLAVVAFTIGRDVGLTTREGRSAPPDQISQPNPPSPNAGADHQTDGSSVALRPGTNERLVESTVQYHWQHRYWQPQGDRLVGFYRTEFGSYEGYILNWRSRRREFFIIGPPRELSSHMHASCFFPRGNDLFFVHFGRTPSSVDAGILEVEMVLAEALTGLNQRPR